MGKSNYTTEEKRNALDLCVFVKTANKLLSKNLIIRSENKLSKLMEDNLDNMDKIINDIEDLGL